MHHCTWGLAINSLHPCSDCKIRFDAKKFHGDTNIRDAVGVAPASLRLRPLWGEETATHLSMIQLKPARPTTDNSLALPPAIKGDLPMAFCPRVALTCHVELHPVIA